MTHLLSSSRDGTVFMHFDIMEESGHVDSALDTLGIPDTLGDIDHLRAPMENISVADATDALNAIDPDLAMQKWIEIAAGLKHQFGEDGYEVWDTWSAKGKKYIDQDETTYRWSTLKANPNRNPVTIRSVFKYATDAGWKNEKLSRREIARVTDWIKSRERSGEELIDHGAAKIASLAPIIGTLERKALISVLHQAFKDFDLKFTLPDLRKEVHKVEVEATRQTGHPAWSKNTCFVSCGGFFYRWSCGRKFTPEVLDLLYTSPSDEDARIIRPRDYLIQTVGVPVVENLRYEPQQGTKRVYIDPDDGNPYCNTYRPTYPAPDQSRAAEAGEFISKHLERLIAEPEYRRVIMDWIAFNVQHPGRKIRWALVIQSGEGAGKTFFAELLEAILGASNVNKIAGSTLFEPTHNDWASGYQIVVVEEIRVIGHNRYAVMDKLKPCITDNSIPLRAMKEGVRKVPNRTNYLMFTNYQDSLAVSESARRYFVVNSPIQTKEQVRALGGGSYFTPLFNSLKENAAGFRAFFESWQISPTFNPDGNAPDSRYLRELAENSASPLAAAIRQVIDDEPHPLVRKDLISLQVLRGLVELQPGLGVCPEQTLGSTLREMGWQKDDRHMLEGERHTLWISRKLSMEPRWLAKLRLELL